MVSSSDVDDARWQASFDSESSSITDAPSDWRVLARSRLALTLQPSQALLRPYIWSQRWHDDPPIGTVVLGHERVIYLGNGDWQSLDETPNH